jgi:hypothetical protein
MQKLQMEMQSTAIKTETERERIASQERQEGARLGVRIATEKDKLEQKDQLEGVKYGIEIARTIAQNTQE